MCLYITYKKKECIVCRVNSSNNHGAVPAAPLFACSCSGGLTLGTNYDATNALTSKPLINSLLNILAILNHPAALRTQQMIYKQLRILLLSWIFDETILNTRMYHACYCIKYVNRMSSETCINVILFSCLGN